MITPDYLTADRHRLFLLAPLVLAAWVEWQLVALPAQPALTATAEESWELPALSRPQAGQAAEMLNTVSLWGKLAELDARPPLNDPEWRLLGIIQRGAERHVIIQVEGMPERTLVPGDALPGGSRILGVENNQLCVLVNERKRRLPLYPREAPNAMLEEEDQAPSPALRKSAQVPERAPPAKQDPAHSSPSQR